MFHQSSRIERGVIAFGTFKELLSGGAGLSGVGPFMLFQRYQMNSSILTLGTFERLFTSVFDHVSLHVVIIN